MGAPTLKQAAVVCFDEGHEQEQKGKTELINEKESIRYNNDGRRYVLCGAGRRHKQGS